MFFDELSCSLSRTLMRLLNCKSATDILPHSFNMMLTCCEPIMSAAEKSGVPWHRLLCNFRPLTQNCMNGQDSAPEWMDAFCIKWFWVASQHHFFFLNRLIREKLDDWSFSLPVINDNQIVRNTSDGVEGNSGLICLVCNIRSCWCRRVLICHFWLPLTCTMGRNKMALASAGHPSLGLHV